MKKDSAMFLGSTWALAVVFAMPQLCLVRGVLAQTPYHVETAWSIGGTGTWDYLTVDAPAHRLYVSHHTTVEVVDTLSGKAIGSIPGLMNAHGIALDPFSKRAWISDGSDNSIVAFDRATLAVLWKRQAGRNPDSIVFDRATDTLWAFSGISRDASVLDPATGAVVATISLSGKPESAVVNGWGKLWVVLENTAELVEIDTRARKVVHVQKIEGCDAPTGLALDSMGQQLLIACDNRKLTVVKQAGGRVVGFAPIGDSPDAVAFSETLHLAFVSNGGGTMTIIDVSHEPRVVQTLPTARGAATLGYDPASDQAFLSVADYGPAPASASKLRHPAAPILPGSFHILVVGRH